MSQTDDDPCPLPYKPIYANPFFRQYEETPKHLRRKLYDPKEVCAIVEQTPEELAMLEGTVKVDPNDVDNETFARWADWAVRTGPCVYRSNSKRMTFGELVQKYPERRPYVIDGLLRQGEIANVIAVSKQGKSFLMDAIAVCVAMGRKLFDTFQCDQGKVLIIDNELHAEEIPWRMTQIARAMAIPLNYLYSTIEFIPLRGRLVSLDALIHEIDDIQPGEYKLIILDALYRLMPPRTDENDNGAMAQIYNKLDNYAGLLDAPICVVHHASKGNQSQKSIIDVGSGAGVQSRACDLHMVLRQLDEENCVVLESASRSSPPITPLGLKFQFPLWRHDPSIDISKLKGAAAEDASAEKTGTKVYMARHALMGTTEKPAALTANLQTFEALRQKIANDPWNIRIGEKLFPEALGTLLGQHLIVMAKIGRANAYRLATPEEVKRAANRPARAPAATEPREPENFEDNVPPSALPGTPSEPPSGPDTAEDAPF